MKREQAQTLVSSLALNRSMHDPNANRNPGPPSSFRTTRWSLVISAGREQTPDARDALESLCHWYWFPLYAYARRRVHDVHQAQDLTQAFFERLLDKNYLADADPSRGRFRSFLITAFKHFLSNEWQKANTLKRGKGVTPFSIDFPDGDSRIAAACTRELTPEQLYERQWVTTLLGRVMERLQQEFAAADKDEQFQQLKACIVGDNSGDSYAEIAERLGATEASIKMAVQRLRRRYRELLRDEIAQTVGDNESVEDEIRCLFQAFQR